MALAAHMQQLSPTFYQVGATQGATHAEKSLSCWWLVAVRACCTAGDTLGNIALLDIHGKEIWERHVKSMLGQVRTYAEQGHSPQHRGCIIVHSVVASVARG